MVQCCAPPIVADPNIGAGAHQCLGNLDRTETRVVGHHPDRFVQGSATVNVGFVHCGPAIDQAHHLVRIVSGYRVTQVLREPGQSPQQAKAYERREMS